MTREEYEQGEQSFYLSLLPKGDGDPDFYGLPEKLSACCLAPINDFGFCTDCLEHAE